MKKLEFDELLTTKTLPTSAKQHGKQSDLSEGYGQSQRSVA